MLHAKDTAQNTLLTEWLSSRYGERVMHLFRMDNALRGRCLALVYLFANCLCICAYVAHFISVLELLENKLGDEAYLSIDHSSIFPPIFFAANPPFLSVPCASIALIVFIFVILCFGSSASDVAV